MGEESSGCQGLKRKQGRRDTGVTTPGIILTLSVSTFKIETVLQFCKR